MLVDVAEASPSPPRRKSKSRHSSSSASAGSSSSSSSRLPLPSRDTSSPVDHDLDFEEQLSRAGKKKPTRRQSGLLSTTMSITTVTPKGYKTEVISQRPPSPAFGSPLRREAGLEEEEEEVLATLGTGEHVEDDDEEEPIALSITRRDKKKKSRENEDVEKEYEGGVKREREKNEKRRSRDTDGTPGPSSYEGKKPKLKDVTNSPPPRPSLATIDSAHGEQLAGLLPGPKRCLHSFHRTRTTTNTGQRHTHLVCNNLHAINTLFPCDTSPETDIFVSSSDTPRLEPCALART